MFVHKGFRFRIYPTAEQVARITAWEGALRFLWNLALEQRLLGLSRTDKRYPTAFDQQREVTDLRAELPWLADVPSNVCSQLLVELDKAWQRCFKRIARAPRWKRKGCGFLGLTEPHPNVWRLDVGLRFPKLGSIEIVLHRPLEGTPKNCTIKRDGDQWFASIMCEVEVAEPVAPSGEPVAIDRGVTNLLADSNDFRLPAPQPLQNALPRLARAQRTVARRKKGSANREKSKLRVARIHRRVRRQRDHVLHVHSTRYAKSHSVVVIESLKTRNMTRSASGSVEQPGSNVRQKSGLNRGILDAGWGRFADMLGYKSVWAGSTVVEVQAAYSSQTCAACGCIDARSRNGERFECMACGHRDHADNNAAKVLLSRGTHGDAVCGGSAAGRPAKQKLRVVRRGTRHVGYLDTA